MQEEKTLSNELRIAATRASGIQLRPATSADAELIVQFIEALAEYEQLRQECVITPEDVRSELFGERPAADVVIAEYNGTPAGFALFFTSFSTFLGKRGIYLEDLFVRPEHRGKGIGKALLLHLVSIAKSQGYGRVEWSVLDWNAPAIAFYESLGARAMNEWTVYRLTRTSIEALA